MESKTYVILLLIFVIEAIFLFIVMRVMFSTDLGYNFQDGFSAVFGSTPATDPNLLETQGNATTHYTQSLRNY